MADLDSQVVLEIAKRFTDWDAVDEEAITNVADATPLNPRASIVRGSENVGSESF